MSSASRLIAVAILAVLSLAGSVLATAEPGVHPLAPYASGPLAGPADWLTVQRGLPTDEAGRAEVRTAFERAAAQAAALGERTAAEDPALAGAEWELMGPTNIGGRVNDVVVDPQRADTIYIAAASGGVWTSADAGQTFEPAWPDHLTQAIGALEITSDGTLYAGTGEANPGGGSLTFGGTGLYRSTDRGASWERVGLPASGTFGRIAADPKDPKRVFAAATGHLYVPGGERGLYRTTDGGATWDLVLAPANDTTGAVDIAIDPVNPRNVLAVMWDHRREPDLRRYGGVGSGLYRSTDGGDTWTKVTSGIPGFAEGTGRIGVAFAPSAPNIAYAKVIQTNGSFEGFYSSVDGGASWTKQPNNPLLASSQSTFGWWFGRLYVDPTNPLHVFVTGVQLMETLTGGGAWVPHATVHADQHAMAFDARSPGRVYLGNDGGMYTSPLQGIGSGTWTAARYQPWMQLYSVDVSETSPERLVAGFQDNGCLRNYAADGTAGADRWNTHVSCGDGLQTLINPVDRNIVYGCSQYGSCRRSNTGGGGTSVSVRGPGARRNWFTPLEFDPTDPSVMYYGSEQVSRSTDGGTSWTSISPDLTGGTGRDTQYPYGTLTTIAAAASDPEVVYAGTDDGRLWRTGDLGGSWVETDAGQLPGLWVTRVAVDPTDADTVVATFSGYRAGSDTPVVLRSTDGAVTFTDISGDLPAAPVNDVVFAGGALVVATDVGVYLSRDPGGPGGGTWLRVGSDLPLAPVMDLRWHAGSGSITAATFGRGAYRIVLPQ